MEKTIHTFIHRAQMIFNVRDRVETGEYGFRTDKRAERRWKDRVGKLGKALNNGADQILASQLWDEVEELLDEAWYDIIFIRRLPAGVKSHA